MDEEGNDTGLVRVQAVQKTEGGVAVNTGGDEEVDEAEEIKLDQFWMFPDIENEFEFAKKKQFKEDYWAFFQDGFVKLAKHKKLFSSKEEFQAAGKRFKAAQKWILANMKELQFFGPESYMIEGESIDEKFAEDTFCSNFAYVKYEQDGSIFFYFVKDAYQMTTF
eukprot:SRR837773.12581.p1 GENE.SRR837773.12581~~SRR837773.12581.p1  ORF type:complete len:185 (+),score=128.17 SRR837773.12581:63-557(+)